MAWQLAKWMAFCSFRMFPEFPALYMIKMEESPAWESSTVAIMSNMSGIKIHPTPKPTHPPWKVKKKSPFSSLKQSAPPKSGFRYFPYNPMRMGFFDPNSCRGWASLVESPGPFSWHAFVSQGRNKWDPKVTGWALSLPKQQQQPFWNWTFFSWNLWEFGTFPSIFTVYLGMFFSCVNCFFQHPWGCILTSIPPAWWSVSLSFTRGGFRSTSMRFGEFVLRNEPTFFLFEDFPFGSRTDIVSICVNCRFGGYRPR